MKAVHVSEIKSFLRCRLAWFWSAPHPRGLGLEPIQTMPALQFGRMIHEALQIGYENNVKFSEAYSAVLLRDLENARQQSVFDDAAEELYAEHLELGVTMLEGYEAWAKPKDEGVHFLALESSWKGIKIGRIPLAGRFDALVEREDGLWVLDFKTTSNRGTTWASQDLQATTYVMAARQLYGPEIRGIIYRFLLKKEPYTYNKLLLKNGTITQRSGLANLTTYQNYLEALAVGILLKMEVVETRDECAALLADPEFKTFEAYKIFSEKFLDARKVYFDILQDLKQVNSFFWEQEEYRTDKQVALTVKHVLLPAAKEMTSKRKGRWIGPTGLGAAFTICSSCKFKTPCELAQRGARYQDILKTEYRVREVR